MDTRRLNLQDSFRLASVLSKYVDLDDPQQEPIEFISGIVDKISPEEYLQCVSLLTREDVETIKKEISLNILTFFVEGLKKNQVVSLLGFYKSFGF